MENLFRVFKCCHRVFARCKNKNKKTKHLFNLTFNSNIFFFFLNLNVHVYTIFLLLKRSSSYFYIYYILIKWPIRWEKLYSRARFTTFTVSHSILVYLSKIYFYQFSLRINNRTYNSIDALWMWHFQFFLINDSVCDVANSLRGKSFKVFIVCHFSFLNLFSFSLVVRK